MVAWFGGKREQKNSSMQFKRALEEMNLTFRLDGTPQNQHFNNFLTSLQQRIGHSVVAAVEIAAHAPQLVQAVRAQVRARRPERAARSSRPVAAQPQG